MTEPILALLLLLAAPQAHAAPARAYRVLNVNDLRPGQCGYATNWPGGDSLFMACVGPDSVFRVIALIGPMMHAAPRRVTDLRARLLSQSEPPPRAPFTRLTWTNPGRTGNLRGCSARPDSLVDLSAARLMFWPQHGDSAIVLRVKSEAGRAGLADSMAIPATAYGTAWLELVDAHGNAGPALMNGACGRRWIGIGGKP